MSEVALKPVTDFQGFTQPTRRFIVEWERNNDRDWFNERKAEYQATVQVSARNFYEAVRALLSETCKAPFGGRIYRIYRDVRFSADKTPYTPNIRMSFWRTSNETARCSATPNFYYRLDATTSVLGTGIMHFDSTSLTRYRTALGDANRGKNLNNLLNSFSEDDGYHTNKPELKRLPSGISADQPWASLWLNKSISLARTIQSSEIDDIVYRPEDALVEYSRLKPVFDWIAQAMED